MKITTLFCSLALLAAAVITADAEEKNGIIATVGRKTIERGDYNARAYTKIDRTQGLALDVKNNSIKLFPEGEVIWTIVVRRAYEGYLDKFTGKEPLKSLKPSEQAKLVFGAAQVGGYRSDYANYKDKLEYEVVIVHGGKETIRLSSTPSFASLAGRATLRNPPEANGDAPKNDGGDKPAVTKIGGDKPGPKGEGEKAVPAKPDAKPAAKGEGEKAMPPKGDTPSRPDADKPAEEPAGKPFDFFNLDKKKKSQPAENPAAEK